MLFAMYNEFYWPPYHFTQSVVGNSPVYAAKCTTYMSSVFCSV